MTTQSVSDPAFEKRTLIFVCLVVFLDMIGIGLIIPVLPELIKDLTDLDTVDATPVGGWLLATYAICLFFAAPILGGLSDRFGRRPVLLVAMFGFALDYFAMAFAPTIEILFFARAISGMCGGTFTAANAAIADVATEESRARNFGLIGGAAGAGLVLGPAFGGILGDFGVRWPFLAAGIITLCSAIFGYFAFKETLKPELRRRFSWRRANPLGNFYQIRTYPVVLWLLAATFFYYFSQQTLNAVWTYYTIERFDWSELQNGLSVALYGASLGAVQALLTRPAANRFGEVPVAVFSLAMGGIVYLGMGLSTAGWMLYVWILIGATHGFAFPLMQTMMTRIIPSDAQGELQGAVSAVVSITAVLSPITMSNLFNAYSDDVGPKIYGMPFFAAAFLCGLCLLSVVISSMQSKRMKTD
ncbi:MAG: MFS transporter [Pseudomonadota bacterium]